MPADRRPLPADLARAIERFAALDRVLIALDFDGTLAPEVDVPDEARATPEAIAALSALRAMPGTVIAFVSGRSLASLDRVVVPLDGEAMIGSHGLELRFAPGDEQEVVDDAGRARLLALRSRLAPLVDAVEGAWIEDKPAGFAVHSRLTRPAAAAALQRRLRSEALAADDRLTVRDGKNVVEFSVRDATKGDGLRALRDRVRPQAVLFAGDDVTDEDALAVLEPGDLGIKVGTAESVAPFRVPDSAAMAALLSELAQLRSAGTAAR